MKDDEVRIGIAKALHGEPDPSVLFEYKTYEKFWEDMATSPAVERLMRLIQARDEQLLERLLEQAVDAQYYIPNSPDDTYTSGEVVRVSTIEAELKQEKKAA